MHECTSIFYIKIKKVAALVAAIFRKMEKGIQKIEKSVAISVYVTIFLY